MITIYILKLKEGKYYIGRTDRETPEERISEHFNSRGSVYTQKYEPVSIVEIINNADEFDEDKYVKKYMLDYGIDNVRGGSYSSLRLTDAQKKFIKMELYSAEKICYKCGEEGHFSYNCRDYNSSKEIDDEREKKNILITKAVYLILCIIDSFIGFLLLLKLCIINGTPA